MTIAVDMGRKATKTNKQKKEIIINHTLLCLSQVSYIKSKSFLFILGELQSDFCENITEFYQISLKIFVYLTDFSSQIMTYMVLSHQTIEDTHFMRHPDQHLIRMPHEMCIFNVCQCIHIQI